MLVAGFIYRQTQASSPVLPLRVVLDGNRGAAYLAIFLISLGQFAMLLFVTYSCRRTLGFTAIQSGLAFLPWLAAFTTMAQLGTRVIAQRVGSRWTLAPGVAVVGVALVVLRHLGVSRRYAAEVLAALVLFGAGAGLAVSSAVDAATSVVEQRDAGAASAMVNTSQMIGASVGTAVLNSLAVSAVGGYLAAHPGQAHAAAHAATHSYDVVFTVAAAVLLIGSVVVGGARSRCAAQPGGRHAASPSGPVVMTSPSATLFRQLTRAVFAAHSSVLRHGDRANATHGQSSARWRAMFQIAEGNGSVSEIARATDYARQSVQRLADTLVADGLATYAPDPDHRRRQTITLTAKGSTLLAAMEATTTAGPNGSSRSSERTP